jgi:hypothetical protein
MSPKDELRALIEETASMAAAQNVPVDKLRGIAHFDSGKDARITSLASFAKAMKALTTLPDLVARFGDQELTRVVLQFVYSYFARIDSARYEGPVFESVWNDFTAEIQEPRWITRGIANVRNFRSDNLHLDLGDGIAIRGRNFDQLASMGFGTPILDRISEDWSGFGASSFVMAVDDSAPKMPDNIITLNSAVVWAKAIRAIGALRLADAGSVSIGPMWVIRAARFNFGIGGVQQTGVSIPALGSQYVWSDITAARYPQIYRELAQLEREGYGRSPGNLAISLRAFMGTYDRWPSLQDSQLVDAITALEALLGTDTEIAFKLAFRIAALLAESDAERAELLKTIKDFYDTRSKLVHGAALKQKHHTQLAKIDELRAIVRRLLRSFVTFAASPPGAYDRQFFTEKLDQALVNAEERERLRAALGLDRE